MFKKLILLIAALFWFPSIYAQADSSANPTKSRLRISLLTCGVGEEAWETFGHTGVRVIDSSKRGPERDVVFNYGMFNGFDKDFEIKFMRGKLLYYVNTQTFQEFMEEYVEFKRSVFEQEIIMDEPGKEQLRQALETNILPENRFYKYDFFFDNCATRIRDIIPKTIQKGFVYGTALPQGAKLSFRDIINQYFYRKHWTRFGVNILLGSKIDRLMTNDEIMFLPDYLSKGLQGATVNGQKISTDPVMILDGSPVLPAGTDQPLVATIIICLLTIAGITINKLRLLGRVMSFLLLFVTGLLGFLVLVMWFGTNHQTCADNFNLLWLLPTNLILAFARPKGRGRYALVAMVLIFATLLLHILKIQGITLLETGPLLLALLFVYGKMYKNSRINA